jgi:hypothetical protein
VKNVSVTPPQEQILGFATQILTVKGSVFAAYFAKSREGADRAPEYDKGLCIVIDDVLVDTSTTSVDLEIAKKLRSRLATLMRGSEVISRIEYRWPWYREMLGSVFSDPFGYKSCDFLIEMRSTLATYKMRGAASGDSS